MPYYAGDGVMLFHGDMRDIVPHLAPVDCIVTDPPYGETSLAWDRWVPEFPALAAGASSSMWCFGSLRMFLDRRDDFALWRLSHDIVWEKPNGSGFSRDRFRRVHELAAHWYLGPWSGVYHEVPVVPAEPRPSATIAVRSGIVHTGAITPVGYTYGNTRLARSVLRAGARRRHAIHRTQKPIEIVRLMIEYACPPGGVVLDCFAGSGTTAVAARGIGRRCVLIEGSEAQCELTARRLTMGVES